MTKIGNAKKYSIFAHVGALITVFAWGISFVSTKVLLENGLGPAEIYIYRFILAYLMILIVCHKRILSNSFRDELLFIICGLCAGSIYFIAENMALEYTFVSNVSLLVTTSPLITTLLMWLIYKNDIPGKGSIIGSLIAFMGVACVIFNSNFVVKMNPIGDILSILAATSWSIYSLVLKKLNALYSVMFISRKTFFYGILTAIPFMFFQPELCDYTVLFKTEVWSNLLFLGAFASMIAYILWAQSVKYLGAIKASNYMYISPIVTLIASIIFLNESLSFIGGIGCALILGGMWLGEYIERKKQS